MRRLVMLLTTMIVVVVGCAGAPVAGDAHPRRDDTEESAGITLPPRPRELPLDSVDPCELLTTAQRVSLGLSERSLPGTTDAPYFAGPTCTVSGFEPRDVGADVGLVTNTGLDQLLAPGLLSDEVAVISVADFPAIVAKPSQPDYCSVDVDVADGQFLDVQFRDSGKNPPIPQDDLCRDAVRVAEAALHTLQTM
ncbi:DUF3558 domain-containing protein [Pseudonocardia lacus]|uniref:DUF3558 domain-containing protein n=1 Tax=Pseudonocardia lacus TaxID=2835865 RepID=UPI001BDCFED9|nr:DUF3558 domain-containing protein [Pseudonocardia lacus]